jgi:hypothetical protein
LPSNLTYLGDSAFAYSDGISFETLPNSLEVLPKEAFRKCKNIKINTFGNDNSKLTTIGNYCFKDAGQDAGPIDNLYFGKKVVNLGLGAFNAYGSPTGVKAVYTPNRNEDLNWDVEYIFGDNNVNNGVVDVIINDEYNADDESDI